MIRSGVPGKLGRIRLKGEALAALRRQCFTRDGWKCQYVIHPQPLQQGSYRCLRPVSWASGHMAHIQSRGAGGSDVLQNVRTLCADCHMKEHNCGGKPVPAK